MLFTTWNVDASQILSRQELATVCKDLKRRARRLPNVQMNLACREQRVTVLRGRDSRRCRRA
jgi:hypothetical protein